MKHNKTIAALAMAGGLFTLGSAHAFAPAVAAGIASLIGAAAGSAANQAEEARAAAAPPTTPTVVLGGPSTVLGGPPALVQESIPAPRDGYTWQQGHFQIQNGVSAWIPGHWVAK